MKLRLVRILSLLISFHYMKEPMHLSSDALLTLHYIVLVQILLPTFPVNIYWKFGNHHKEKQPTAFWDGLDFLPGQAHIHKIFFHQQVSCMPLTPIEAKNKTPCLIALLQIFPLSTPAPSLNVLCLGCCFDVASGSFETITWGEH